MQQLKKLRVSIITDGGGKVWDGSYAGDGVWYDECGM